MNKKIKILLVLILLLGGIGLFIWNFVHKGIESVKNRTVEASYSSAGFMQFLSDENKLKENLGKTFEIDGIVSKIEQGEHPIIVLSDDGMNSIIVQMDKRFEKDFANTKEKDKIKLLAELSGYSADDMGLGITVECKYGVIKN